MPLARFSLFAATMLTVVAAGATAFGRLPSREIGVAILLFYVALVALGLRRPSLQMFADAVVSAGESIVALTFDTTLHPERTRALLDALEARDAKGTLFVDGASVAAHPALAAEVIARGHALGTRGFSSQNATLTRSFNALCTDAERDDDAWNVALGSSPLLYRPDGAFTPRIARVADEYDRALVAHTADLRGLSDREAIERRAVRALASGALLRFGESDAVPLSLAAVLDAAARLGISARVVSAPS